MGIIDSLLESSTLGGVDLLPILWCVSEEIQVFWQKLASVCTNTDQIGSKDCLGAFAYQVGLARGRPNSRKQDIASPQPILV